MRRSVVRVLGRVVRWSSDGKKPAIPERFWDARRRHPEGLLRTKEPDEDAWMTPEVLSTFERELLSDLQVTSDHEYITRRRRQGDLINPEEYDFVEHAGDRAKPPPLIERLDKRKQRGCEKRHKRYHLIPPEHITVANLPLLHEFLSENGSILKRTTSRLCGTCQRKLRKTVKRARHLGFIPHDAGFSPVNLLGFPDAHHKVSVSKTI
ncbi:hypothetical protein CTAYLR_003775 [Chrysophaeum taylorii]|uniref:Ribosomal protein S18 n=1 Tax=Chrysophaeum taylorii TaxID=2483200 RepID=A0AAD7UEC4_9STRA|nr:hypothetical protein CTAYLR_003775 [Chrysophaeum taylorii]